jgi:hypothetical protein
MNFLSLIFRRKQRLERPRKRPGRKRPIAFAPLESRALLTFIGPVASASVAMVATLPEPYVPNDPPDSPGKLDFGNPNSGTNNWNRPVNGANPDSPFTRLRNHVALSEATVTVNGISSPEFALANAGDDEVRVRIGNETTILDATDGINDPQSVLLAYLNNDGDSATSNPYPDLIVANSGGNNVLVFPGLPGGEFGPALNGPQGFAVGQDPVSVSVGDVDGNGVPDLLVANQGSNSISILLGNGNPSAWNSNATETIDVGNQNTNTAPVKALYVDANGDGIGDIVVCNSGSNNVYVYEGNNAGSVNVTNPLIFAVGNDPIDMLYGRFDQRPQADDLVTVNSGSNNLTQIDGIFTANPISQTISSGGVMPDAAFAFSANPNNQGIMDLVVANSGDGRLAILQAGYNGLQVAGVITSTDLPIPTGLAPSASTGSGIEFIAATAGQDAADILRFDLGANSSYLATPASESSGNGGSDGGLIAGLMPYGDSSMELIAVFSVGGPDQEAINGESNLREPSSITALYSPTEGQGNGTLTPTAETSEALPESQATPTELGESDAFTGIRYITGIDQTLQSPGKPIDSLGLGDLPPILVNRDDLRERIVELDNPLTDPIINADDESTNESLKDALQRETLERQTRLPTENPPLEPTARTEDRDTSPPESQVETAPLLSSVTLLSARLIFRASTPRPPLFRKGASHRVAGGKPEERGPGTPRP